MNIKTKLTEKDFINANFVLLYSKASTKIVTSIGILALLMSVVILLIDVNQFTISQLVVPVFLLPGVPLFTYVIARKNYKSSLRISEEIEYHFDKDSFYNR